MLKLRIDMRLPAKDWEWACVAAAGLTLVAIAIVFGIRPGGFEGQAAWYLILLPGGIPAEDVSDFMNSPRVGARTDSFVFWLLLVGFNLLWYWLVSFVVLKVHRALS